MPNADCVDSGPSISKARENFQSHYRHRNPRSEKEFDASKYSSRFIALKIAYLGQAYNGFEHHPNNTTPFPTIEETLWKALMKARLISPTPDPTILDGTPNFHGCEYSKCGRTDKGVSAFGQVIGIKVRSNRLLTRASTPLGAQRNDTDRKIDDVFMYQSDLAGPSLVDYEMEDDPPSSTLAMSLDQETPSFHPIQDEIRYCQVLNRLLPPDIRILAWCPAPPPDFSARFSCRERHYKYFFTQPAFAPTPGLNAPSNTAIKVGHNRRRDGYLDIASMKLAAKRFEGVHDFRNFCKVDASKQIDNFERLIFHADIVEHDASNAYRSLPTSFVSDSSFEEYEHPRSAKIVSDGRDSHVPAQSPMSPTAAATGPSPTNASPKIYAFNLHGNAFLWHQVRHMVAILFLIGQGLEPISLIDDLLDINKQPCRPHYDMADAAPLVLWNCVFPQIGSDVCGSGSRGVVDAVTGRAADAMEWIYVGDEKILLETDVKRRRTVTGIKGGGKYGYGGVVDDLWRVWRGRKMDEILAGTLLDVAVRQGVQDREGLEGDGKNGKGDTGFDYHITPRRKKGGRLPSSSSSTPSPSSSSQKIFQGGDAPKNAGVYVPVLKKPRMDSVEVINERYREKKASIIKGEKPKTGG